MQNSSNFHVKSESSFDSNVYPTDANLELTDKADDATNSIFRMEIKDI